MPVTDSRQNYGVLTVDAVPFQTQATNVTITPPKPPDSPDLVLSGDALAPEDADSWTLKVTAIQDFTNPDGFLAMTWTKQGETVPFTWQPTGATGPTYSGNVQVWPVEHGGDVNKRLDTDAEWIMTAKPTITYPGG